MKNLFLNNIRILFLIFLFSIPLYIGKLQSKSFKIDDLQVVKRNNASCSRLGNVYDACQWITKFSIKNLSQNDLRSLCFLMKVNRKTYELCYGKNKKLIIYPKDKKTFLVNLSKQMDIANDSEKPLVKIIYKK